MSVAGFISSQRAEHGVPHATACRALGVSESWFYKWHQRLPSPRQRRRAELDEAVRRVFDASGGTYGSPRITAELKATGWRIGENTVAASMAAQQLVARPKRRRRSLTRADKTARRAPDLVGRDFTAPAPNVKWCGDLTEIPTAEGKLYLAAVEDLFSRRLLGFAMSDRHDAESFFSTLEHELLSRPPVRHPRRSPPRRRRLDRRLLQPDQAALHHRDAATHRLRACRRHRSPGSMISPPRFRGKLTCRSVGRSSRGPGQLHGGGRWGTPGGIGPAVGR